MSVRTTGKVGALLAMLLASPLCRGRGSPTYDDALRHELLQMMENDQELGARSFPGGEPERDREMAALDDIHTARLKQIVATVGWPDARHVGEDGAMAAWLIAQHTSDLEFLERCLPLMKASASRGELGRGLVALTTDRILVRRGKPQVYGSQFLDVRGGGPLVPHPIEDEANVDARRAEVGLPPLAEYKQMLLELRGARGAEDAP